MVYLRYITFPDADREFDYLLGIKRKCYRTFYPFQVLSAREFSRIDFEPLTVLYGGNGTGKSTALNVIAEKAGAEREAPYNRSNFYEDYVRLCRAEWNGRPKEIRIVTSDDVFSYMLDLRRLNAGVDEKREEIFEEYLKNKYSDFHFRTMEDYDVLKKVTEARRKTQSRYVRENLVANVREYSNGESAMRYFFDRLGEDALYLLDEPENSLAPDRQEELAAYLADCVRFFGCQIVLATHSPFFLAMPGAKIYNLEETPVAVSAWTELRNVRVWHDFFKRHEKEFET